MATLLVIEDEEVLAKNVRRALQKLDHVVHLAASGAEGEQAFAVERGERSVVRGACGRCLEEDDGDRGVRSVAAGGSPARVGRRAGSGGAGAFSDADTGALGHSAADGDCDSEAESDADPPAERHGDSLTDFFADPKAHGHADPEAHGHADTEAERYSHADAHARADEPGPGRIDRGRVLLADRLLRRHRGHERVVLAQAREDVALPAPGERADHAVVEWAAHAQWFDGDGHASQLGERHSRGTNPEALRLLRDGLDATDEPDGVVRLRGLLVGRSGQPGISEGSTSP